MTSATSQGFLEAAARGLDWILSNQRTDGSFCDVEDGIGGYYKTPYVLALAGRQPEAQRLATWIAGHHHAANGDFRAPQRKAREPFHDAWPVYGNAWLVQGAELLGRRDLSRKAMQYLLTYQTDSGGFYALDGETRFLEPVCTAWGGMAALATGYISEACRAGDLLTRLVADQPDPSRFTFRMNVAGNPVTEIPVGQELSHYVDAGRTKQIYYNPGITMIFLAHLFRATGEERYLDACQDLLAFTSRCADDVYRFPPSGKLGVGCALLYTITGSAAARQAAICVAEYLVEMQTEEGNWHLPDEELYAAVQDREGLEVQLDLSSEFSTWLIQIAALV